MNMFAKLFQPALRVSEFLPSGEDVHCHILPGVDDGAPHEEAAFAIVAAQVKAGLTGAICTPHIMERYQANTPAALRASFESFCKRVAPFHPTFTLKLGAEYMLDSRFPAHLAERESLLTWPAPPPMPGSPAAGDAPGTPYLLVELPQYMLPSGWANMLESIQRAGITPVLAHPERYHRILGENDILALHRRGVRLQGNVGSLAAYYGKGAASLVRKLRVHNIYSWWGTDAHADDIFSHIKLRS